MEFQQEFQALLLSQPRFNLKQVASGNCDYADVAVKSGNCYYTFGAFYSEDVLYGRYSRKCRDCVDISFCVNCEGCFSCVDCVNCNMMAYSKKCQDCTESKFCMDCFGCVYLANKEYYILNRPYSPEDYYKTVAAIKQRLISNHEYNMLMYFASNYEQERLVTETDSVIKMI